MSQLHEAVQMVPQLKTCVWFGLRVAAWSERETKCEIKREMKCEIANDKASDWASEQRRGERANSVGTEWVMCV